MEFSVYLQAGLVAAAETLIRSYEGEPKRREPG